MARKPIIGGNWKMNGTLGSVQQLAAGVRRSLGSHHGVDIVVFPPAPFLPVVQAKMAGSSVKVGAQDVHPEPSGAYTGGTSAPMVESLGCRFVLVGHSERRAWFGDSDQRVAQKLGAVLAAGLSPVLCVGETLAERDGGRTFAVIDRQLQALGSHKAAALSGLVIAYEPVWAIGTGRTATPEQAQQVHAHIRGRIAERFDEAFAAALRIQYGGSVKPANAAALMACPDIDGALVGGASLDARAFGQIVRAASRQTPGSGRVVARTVISNPAPTVIPGGAR